MGSFVAYWSDTIRQSLISLGGVEYQEHVVVKTKLSRQIAVRTSLGVMDVQVDYLKLLQHFPNKG